MEMRKGFGHLDPQPRDVLGGQQGGGEDDALTAGLWINVSGMRC